MKQGRKSQQAPSCRETIVGIHDEAAAELRPVGQVYKTRQSTCTYTAHIIIDKNT